MGGKSVEAMVVVALALFLRLSMSFALSCYGSVLRRGQEVEMAMLARFIPQEAAVRLK